MKKILWSALCLIVGAAGVYGQDIVPPSVRSKTTFAIVIDRESYTQAKEAVEAYKKVIESDGLGTYIVSHEWSNPDEIRELLIRLHEDKKSPLEGTVLVGDIPIPLLRDAQHLTSAFKMDQNRNWQQSSVPSDRFYDDFGLKFDFIKQDSVKPLWFYYSLRADSEQILHSDIYSARIRPLEKHPLGKYDQLKNYLNKVVRIRTEEKQNVIDNLTVARGHGYNSESRVSWSGEQLALREQLPQAFNPGSYVKFMDFDSYWPMKPYWLNEIQRPELDVMLFHHHGSNDLQYVNGYKEGSDINTSIENIKLYLRSKVFSAVKGGKNKEEAIEYYVKTFDVPRSWCEEAFDPEKQKQDSIFNENLDIQVSDLLAIKPNARFVLFDACYNGSFYEDEYIAGAYIFNDGNTIVTQANTVNALQDKWPDQYIGLLDCGIRVGMWGKYVHYLETHILGDPTFRFAKRVDPGFDLNEALTVKDHDAAFWKKVLKSPYADLQAIALRVLFESNYSGISGLLKETCLHSPNMVVRAEALVLLSRLNDDNFLSVLEHAASDSYELTKRFAIDFITMNGSETLIPALARAILNDNTSKRIVFKISSGLRTVDLDKLEQELALQAQDLSLYSRATLDNTLKSIASTKTSREKDLKTITDKSAAAKSRKFEITRFRNQPFYGGIDVLLTAINDPEYEPELRQSALEALGWFDYSYRVGYIVENLNRFIAQNQDNLPLVNEARKTINRLQAR
jgi:hypothetical protein